jgi:hypothetical protein
MADFDIVLLAERISALFDNINFEAAQCHAMFIPNQRFIRHCSFRLRTVSDSTNENSD